MTKYPAGRCRTTFRGRFWNREVGERRKAMIGVVATWVGAVLGLLVLVLMALAGVLVDSQR
ncbi:hypothetical protein GCM10010185_08110 [Saccharothrix coeruleofusca]|uniref:Uncharacterized protein n=1 Tax=Saccharothrix coeruleofusca TaxID=33919 RepID=A0A918AHP8_9PSEU|nr:hypothetical protein GCM10010185_08110 [Saccharothrix coeruleofusca]